MTLNSQAIHAEYGAVIYVYVLWGVGLLGISRHTDAPKMPVLGPPSVFRYDVFSNTGIFRYTEINDIAKMRNHRFCFGM